MREDARWLAVYGAAFVECFMATDDMSEATVRGCRKLAERLADCELSTRSEHPFPKEP